MGNKGQNSPNNTSDAERKRPWEIFSEEEIAAIKANKEKKENYRNKTLRQNSINKFRTIAIKHKILVIIFAVIFILACIICSFLIKEKIGKKNHQNIEEETQVGESERVVNDWPYNGVEIKELPTPEIAYSTTISRLKPILLEGISDTGVISFSKIEDNYEAFIKDIKSDYDKTCYYLAMIDTMFGFDSEPVLARAAYLLERFDERKMNLDKIQYIFYLHNLFNYADYKKDETLVQKYHDEYNKKYTYDDSYIDFDTGAPITDNRKIKDIKDKFNRFGEKNENKK